MSVKGGISSDTYRVNGNKDKTWSRAELPSREGSVMVMSVGCGEISSVVLNPEQFCSQEDIFGCHNYLNVVFNIVIT